MALGRAAAVALGTDTRRGPPHLGPFFDDVTDLFWWDHDLTNEPIEIESRRVKQVAEAAEGVFGQKVE